MNKSPQTFENPLIDDLECQHLIKLIDRTSEIYKELISKNINSSSAYKLPEKISNFSKSLSKEKNYLEINELNRKKSSDENNSYDKLNILNLMSYCRKTLTIKISSNKNKIRNSLSPFNLKKTLYKQTSDFSEDYAYNSTNIKNNVSKLENIRQPNINYFTDNKKFENTFTNYENVNNKFHKSIYNKNNTLSNAFLNKVNIVKIVNNR